MTIWILALLFWASGIGLGLRQGAVRAAFSFVGIVLAALLAVPLGKIFKPLLPHLGFHNPTLIWAIAPLPAFCVVLAVFKFAGFFVHRKASLFYKYQAGDLRQALFLRLNSRLGACVGILNGTVYLVLLAFVIFNFTYWTVQIASSDSEARTTRWVNRLGQDLQSTGLDKAARATAALPDNYYKIADLAGLLCQNPQLGPRLANYPAFISLTESDAFQQLANDANFTGGWKQGAPMGQLLDDPQVQSILQNDELIHTVWNLVATNLDDLLVYLKTDQSPKYDSEKIVGRWDFNVGVSLAMLRQKRPNIPSNEMRALRALWNQAFGQTTFVAGTDDQAFLKNLPNFKSRPPSPETWKGNWDGAETNYNLTLDNNGAKKSLTAKTDGLRLTLADKDSTMVFDRAE